MRWQNSWRINVVDLQNESSSTYSVPFHGDPAVLKPSLLDTCACSSHRRAEGLPCFESYHSASNIHMLQVPMVGLSACNALNLSDPSEHRAASKSAEFCTIYIADLACWNLLWIYDHFRPAQKININSQTNQALDHHHLQALNPKWHYIISSLWTTNYYNLQEKQP